MDYNKEIAEAFESVCELEGVEPYKTHAVSVRGRFNDNYLLMGHLCDLIGKGVIDIRISDDISDSDLDYLQRLLHIKERGDDECIH